jgi:hypothetical protein
MRREPREISELTLEQYALGELPPGERGRVEEALRKDGSMRARLAELERSNREILAAYPPERIAPMLKRRLEEKPPRERKAPKRPPMMMFVLPAAAALAVFLSVYPVRDRVAGFARATASGQETRLKTGDTHLSLYRKTRDGAERLAEGSEVRRRDVLQISYFAGRARFGTIFSVDGRGALTFHLPEGYRSGPRMSPQLEGSGEIVLPFAYELDDAPGFERFFFVFSGAAFDVKGVAKAAELLCADPRTADRALPALPGGVESFSIIVRKQK